MVRIYDQSLADATLSFKVSKPGTLRYQIDDTAVYASAGDMDAAQGSAALFGTFDAPVGAQLETIDTTSLASGLWYIHLVQNAGEDSVPVSVSFTKIASNAILTNVRSLALTGNQATITYNRNVLANAGGLTLTTFPASVTTGANTVINANAGSLTLTTNGAVITIDRNVNANVRSLAFTTYAATVDVGGSFSPSSLFSGGEQGGWWDPSDLSTMWKDTAGTDPVTADGDAVARIDDKSGRGNHLTQATAANRPLYKTSGGLHWLQFDGTNDRLVAPAQAWLVTGSLACAGFLTNNANADQYIVASQRDNIAPEVRHAQFLRLRLDTTPRSLLTTAFNNSSSFWEARGTSTIASGTRYTGTSVISTSTVQIYRNGTLETTASGAPANFQTGTKELDVGAVSFNDASTWVNFLNGNIYQLVIVSRPPTGSERTDLEAFVAGKTGI